jgi:hypothetical protein
MFTVVCLLAGASLILAILALMNKVPVGPVLVVLAIVELLHCLPIR